jgi:hypothetical protein
LATTRYHFKSNSYNASNTSFASGATISGSYLQAVLQNKSGTAGASTNFAVSNDLATDSTYYGEFGMNSSVFTASGTFADFYAINNGIYFGLVNGGTLVPPDGLQFGNTINNGIVNITCPFISTNAFNKVRLSYYTNMPNIIVDNIRWSLTRIG